VNRRRKTPCCERVVGDVRYQTFSLSRHGGQRVGGMKYDNPGSPGGNTLSSLSGKAEPAAVAEAGCKAADEANLRQREPIRRLGPMQTQVAPTPGIGNQRCPEFIAHSEG